MRFILIISLLSIILTPAHASAWLGRLVDAPDISPEAKDAIVAEWLPLQIEAKKFHLKEKGQIEHPKLKYIGGLELKSTSEKFGGISGHRIIVKPNDRLQYIAVNDRALWLRADISTDKLGAITQLNSAETATMMRQNGNLLEPVNGDSEGLAIAQDGPYKDQLLVSYEHYHRIDAFQYQENGRLKMTGRIMHHRVLPKDLEDNGSLESIEILNDGRLLSFAESPVTYDKSEYLSHMGFLSSPENWHAREDSFQDITMLIERDYGITDMAQDRSRENGDLYIIHRAYSPAKGTRIKFLRSDVTAVKKDANLNPEVIAKYTSASGIDNMEAIALHRMEDGRLILYAASDDNFSIRQRTLLLSFEVIE